MGDHQPPYLRPAGKATGGGGRVRKRLTWDEKIRELVDAHGYTKAQILEMEPWYIDNFLFWPRDKKGRLLPSEEDEPAPPPPPQLKPFERFRLLYRENGFSEREIDRIWEEIERPLWEPTP